MYRSRSVRAAIVLLSLAGCTNQRDLGSLPDGGSGSGNAGNAGPGAGGRGGQAGSASGTAGDGGGAGGSTAGAGGATGSAGSGGATAGGGGATGNAGTGGGSGGSSGVAGAGGGGATGNAGTGGGGATGSGGTAGGGATGGAGTGGGGATGSGGTAGGGATGGAGTGGGGATGSGGTAGGGATGGAGTGGGSGGSAGGGRGGATGGGGTGGGAGGSAGSGGTVGSCVGAPNQTGRGPVLISIVGGTFTTSAPNLNTPSPTRTIPIDSFRIDQTMVTAGQYRECVQAGCCTVGSAPGGCNYSATPAGRDNYPMNCLNLAEAIAFCTWAGKELPTEEQWEYAARGPDPMQRIYPWGNVGPLWSNQKLVAPSPVCSADEVPPAMVYGCPVGAHSPEGDTPDGVRDMTSNGRQWTSTCDNTRCVVKGEAAQYNNWFGTFASADRLEARIEFLGFRCVRAGGAGGAGGSGGTETHTITEFALPTTAQPNSIAAGPDGNLWFTEAGSSNVGRITPAGQITEFPLPTTASRAGDLTAGPDGNMWFTATGAGKIGAITPAGVITMYSPPSPFNSPTSIAKAPFPNDTSLLVSYSNQVGRLSTSGSLFQTDPLASGISEMVVGPDLGTAWVVGPSTGVDGAVFRVGTSSGWTFTEFPVAGSGAIRGVTVGPNRTIWFTTAIDRIGRMTTSGTLTRFRLPNPGASPYGIATGPDGNLWFTENTGNQIGRITPTGVISEYPVPTASAGLRGIAAGSDGNLWFTEYTAGKIGRITP